MVTRNDSGMWKIELKGKGKPWPPCTGIKMACHALDKLAMYCNKWKLNININKTKSMIFDKTGKLFKNYNFIYLNSPIETVNLYKYLRIEFTTSGSFTTATNLLKVKASKAFYMLKQSNIQRNIKVGFQFFHSLIMPIMSYRCEIWSPFLLKNINVQNTLATIEKLNLEVLHNKFCKYILGVHRNSPTLAVKGELGSYPVALKFIEHTMKYWLRLTEVENTSLIYKCYCECKKLNSIY